MPPASHRLNCYSWRTTASTTGLCVVYAWFSTAMSPSAVCRVVLPPFETPRRPKSFVPQRKTRAGNNGRVRGGFVTVHG